MTVSRVLTYNDEVAQDNVKYLLGLLVVFEISDGVLTRLLVKGGLAREANPFLVPIVGENGFIWLKVVGVLLCAVILWDVYKRYPRAALAVTWCFVIFYGALALWNLSLLAIA